MEDNERINGFYVFELKEGSWTTAFDGAKHFSEITQQHWSNIYWYHSYLVEQITKTLELLNNEPKIKNFMNEQVSLKSIYFGEILEEILQEEISIKKKKLEIAKNSANFGLAQIKYRFSGKLLDWEPIYDNEKEWYKEQCTRKLLTEKYLH